MKAYRQHVVSGAAVLALGGIFAAGCWLQVGPWPHEGYATIQWNIDGERDEASCASLGADRVRIRTLDAAGRTESLSAPLCTTFQQTLLVDTGWYRAELTMIDAGGRAISNTLSTESFRVVRDGTVIVNPVSFPGAIVTLSASTGRDPTRVE